MALFKITILSSENLKHCNGHPNYLRISVTLEINADEDFDKITWSQAGIPKSGNINARRKSVDCRIGDSKLSRTEVDIIPSDKSSILTNLKGLI